MTRDPIPAAFIDAEGIDYWARVHVDVTAKGYVDLTIVAAAGAVEGMALASVRLDPEAAAEFVRQVDRQRADWTTAACDGACAGIDSVTCPTCTTLPKAWAEELRRRISP